MFSQWILAKPISNSYDHSYDPNVVQHVDAYINAIEWEFSTSINESKSFLSHQGHKSERDQILCHFKDVLLECRKDAMRIVQSEYSAFQKVQHDKYDCYHCRSFPLMHQTHRSLLRIHDRLKASYNRLMLQNIDFVLPDKLHKRHLNSKPKINWKKIFFYRVLVLFSTSVIFWLFFELLRPGHGSELD